MSTARGPARAVLLDVFGTLLELEQPVSELRSQLAARLGVAVSLQQARAALGAEVAHYRAHMALGRDADSLSELRRQCAEVMRRALPPDPALLAAPPPQLVEVLLASLRFRVHDDVADTLALLRAAGLRLVVVSNWDASLPEVLERAGLAAMLDGVVSSAVVGAAKPDPLPFIRGLELAGVAAGQAVHVGDVLAEDVRGAHAAGVAAVLLQRQGSPPRAGSPPPADPVTVITSLAELPTLLGLAADGPPVDKLAQT